MFQTYRCEYMLRNFWLLNFAFKFHYLDSELTVHTFSLGKNMNCVNSDMLPKLKCLEMK
jgi:hypothetical protein